MPYPGAYGAAQQFLESYPGRAQLEDILDASGQDYLYVEAEYSTPPVPLGQLNGGGMGMDMSMAPPSQPDPGSEMRDLLAERAKSRLSASQRFQSKAAQLRGGGY